KPYPTSLGDSKPKADDPKHPSRKVRIDVNVRGPLVLSHGFGARFRARGRGGIVLLSSMGALQGMVRVANYSATKAYNLVLAEGLWAELRDDGVDVLVSCAGATRTPNYLASEPQDANVPVQEPEQVAVETLNALGKKPTVFPAPVLRFTHFAFRHLMGRRTAVRLMAYASNRTYKEQDSYSTGDRR
ncbi:SDR family NAD(P)-dependent oxidoreductase, partial [Mycolicibacterium agri]|uniref:SDR family NAD(P)-dependent oxidoreductase n=1 Tax=Mycolicibacterium agri TaxID=36811 RepID=UPI001055B4C3